MENVIDADPVAAWVRDLMAERTTWTGTASDVLQMSANVRGQAPPGHGVDSAGWPKNPRVLAGRLRRAQTFLRALGIEIVFGREGRVGTRIIRMTAPDNSPRGIVSTVRSEGPPRPGHPRLTGGRDANVLR